MMARASFVLVLILTGAIACSAQAAASEPQPVELSLRQAIEKALSSNGNISLQLALQGQNIARAHFIRERSVLLPNIDGSVTEQNQIVNLRALGLRFQPNPAFTFPTRVGPFDVFDARGSQLQTAGLERASAGAGFASGYGCGRGCEQAGARAGSRGSRKGVRRSPARRCEVETAKADVSLAQALFDVSSHRESAEEGTHAETTRASVKVSRNQQRLLAAESSRTRAHLDLIYAINLDWNTALQLTDQLGLLRASLWLRKRR